MKDGDPRKTAKHNFYSQKSKRLTYKTCGKRKVVKKTNGDRETGATMDHGAITNRPWCPLTGLCSLDSSVTSSWNLLDRGTGHDLSVLGVIGSLLLSSLIHKASIIFIYSNNLAYDVKSCKNSQN